LSVSGDVSGSGGVAPPSGVGLVSLMGSMVSGIAPSLLLGEMTRRRAGSTGEDRLLKTIAAPMTAHPHGRRPGPTISPTGTEWTGSAGEAANPPCTSEPKRELHGGSDSDKRLRTGPLG